MIANQIDLDFDGSNSELQLRLRWAENAARDRAFWTPERACLAWMQNTTPDESDIKWWASQPKYKRQNWLDLHKREGRRAKERREWRRPFQEAWEEWEAIITEGIRQDEERIAGYMEILRADFLAGRPCSLSFECDKSHHRQHSEYLLRLALERLGIPQECINNEGRAA